MLFKSSFTYSYYSLPFVFEWLGSECSKICVILLPLLLAETADFVYILYCLLLRGRNAYLLFSLLYYTLPFLMFMLTFIIIIYSNPRMCCMIWYLDLHSSHVYYNCEIAFMYYFAFIYLFPYILPVKKRKSNII